MKKLISWNVNGFRACLKKGFEDFFKTADADVFCLQETKMQPDQADFSPEGYHKYFSSAEKKGYSGTAVYSRTEPLSVTYGIDGKYNDEGRVITCEFEESAWSSRTICGDISAGWISSSPWSTPGT